MLRVTFQPWSFRVGAATRIALLSLLAIVAASQGVGLIAHSSRLGPGHAALVAHGNSGKTLSSLPLAAQGIASAAIGSDSAAYKLRDHDATLSASNPAQRLDASFGPSGVSVGTGALKLHLALGAIGYGSLLRPVHRVSPRADANRVIFARDGVREWYANGPLGIEQGFTIAHAPPASVSGLLTLSLAITGNARASLDPGAHGLTFFYRGRASLRYGALAASDARGRALRSWLELHGAHILLRVAARGALYPIRIDPLIQQGFTLAQQGSKLTGGGETAEGKFGWGVAVSADGSTALVGGPGDNSSAGAAWVFVRSGSAWVQQGSKLTGTGESGKAGFGVRVAISADGNTALIAGTGDNSNTGAVWIFTRSGSTWTQQGSKLTGSEGVGTDVFGSAIALSADGNTALVGGFGDNKETGAAWTFTRSGSTWTQQGPKLTGAGETEGASFGASVALSADGNTAMIGAPGDSIGVGAVLVYTRSGSKWTQQGEKLKGGEENNSGFNGAFGVSVSLSADGNTALIGGRFDNKGAGAAWAFTRSGSTWSQQGPKLTASGEVGAGEFGTSLSVSADGNTALIGAHLDNKNVGAAWVFTRSGTTWTQRGEKITGGGEVGEGVFGFNLALSSDGNTALVGGAEDNGNTGAAWIFNPKLTGGGESGKASFGASAALSSDGNTALVGGFGDNVSKGAAWVFTRTGSTWSQQGEKLTGSGEVGEGEFGESVALSADGNTALIGGSRDNGKAGAAWVFTRSGGVWTQQGSKLTGGGEVGEGVFGDSVALSSDGNTALIGGGGDNNFTGAAWAFTRSGGVWTQQGSKLTGGSEVGQGAFGLHVAASSDGNTALIGGNGDNSLAGAAWVLTRSGSTWSQQAKLTGGGEIGKGQFGSATALSSDGNTALIGGDRDNSSTGAAWVFTRSGSTWTQQGEKLTGSGASGGPELGVSAALSSDGNTALIGGDDDASATGAAWEFTRSGTTWTQLGEKLTGLGETAGAVFGASVALSSDAGTALIGGLVDNSSVGAAWVFVAPPTVTKLKPTKGPVGGGTTVTITGTNLSGTWRVAFGPVEATSFKVNSATSVTAVAPAQAAGTVDVRVDTYGGTSAISTKDRFKFAPTITKVVPNSGGVAGGTSVTITGTGFALGKTATTIKFGTTKGTSVNCASSTQCTVTSPAHAAATVDVTATVNKVTSVKTSADKFTYS